MNNGRGCAEVLAHRRFWWIAPLAAIGIGQFMAVQGLWAVPWLIEVNRFDRAVAAQHLLVMGLTMLAGYVALGLFSTRLARHGAHPRHLFGFGFALNALALVAIVAEIPGTWLWWSVYGLGATVNVLGFTVVTDGFGAGLAGRASTALNLLMFIGSFSAQWGIGVAIDAARAGLGLDLAGGLRLALGSVLGAVRGGVRVVRVGLAPARGGRAWRAGVGSDDRRARSPVARSERARRGARSQRRDRRLPQGARSRPRARRTSSQPRGDAGREASRRRGAARVRGGRAAPSRMAGALARRRAHAVRAWPLPGSRRGVRGRDRACAVAARRVLQRGEGADPREALEPRRAAPRARAFARARERGCLVRAALALPSPEPPRGGRRGLRSLRDGRCAVGAARGRGARFEDARRRRGRRSRGARAGARLALRGRRRSARRRAARAAAVRRRSPGAPFLHVPDLRSAAAGATARDRAARARAPRRRSRAADRLPLGGLPRPRDGQAAAARHRGARPRALRGSRLRARAARECRHADGILEECGRRIRERRRARRPRSGRSDRRRRSRPAGRPDGPLVVCAARYSAIQAGANDRDASRLPRRHRAVPGRLQAHRSLRRHAGDGPLADRGAPADRHLRAAVAPRRARDRLRTVAARARAVRRGPGLRDIRGRAEALAAWRRRVAADPRRAALGGARLLAGERRGAPGDRTARRGPRPRAPRGSRSFRTDAATTRTTGRATRSSTSRSTRCRTREATRRRPRSTPECRS